MDPISQGALGAVVPQAVAAPDKVRAFGLIGCAAGMAPDLDVFISSPTDTLLFLEYHRQFTHALVFIPIGAAVVALLLHGLVRRGMTLRETYLACLLGYATHGVLDACTSYGTQLFWPFSDHRVAWNNVSVVDPLFTLPLLGLVIAAALARSRRLAIGGAVWALLYLLVGVAQNHRAEAAGAALAQARGHEPKRLTAKPGFANLLVWKVVYEHDGRYYVDAVRVGASVAICPGDSVAILDVERDLPWLSAGSQQARDVERFRWFSDGYVAMDQAVPNRIIDVRYSVVPNQIAALWGIDLDPAAAPAEFARFTADRAGRVAQRAAYAALLTGEACAPTAG